LLANYANLNYADQDGWTAIHHAAYFDNVPIIRLLLLKQPELIEIQTRNESKRTAILVAASSGSLEAIKCLIDHGANMSTPDGNGYNCVQVAAQR
jgi:uncharacterized protein